MSSTFWFVKAKLIENSVNGINLCSKNLLSSINRPKLDRFGCFLHTLFLFPFVFQAFFAFKILAISGKQCLGFTKKINSFWPKSERFTPVPVAVPLSPSGWENVPPVGSGIPSSRRSWSRRPSPKNAAGFGRGATAPPKNHARFPCLK